MDWLNHLTHKWSLKKAFVLYLLSFLCLGFIVSQAMAVPLSSYISTANNKDLTPVHQGQTTTYTYRHTKDASLVLVRGLHDSLDLIGLATFALLGFHVFYCHKLKAPLEAISKAKDHVYLANVDELSLAIRHMHALKDQHHQALLAENYRHQRFQTQMATLAHGIKNPLTVVKANVEMLGQIEGHPSCLYKDLLGGLKVNTGRIEAYVQKLKTCQEIDFETLNLTSVVVGVFEETLKETLEYYKDFIDLHVDFSNSSRHITMDTFKIQECLDAVIENCLRYAKKNITLTFKEETTHYAIDIQDDGPGFSPIGLQEASRPYFSENPGVSNMGLGLYYAKTVLQHHKGKITLSNTDKGAHIKIILPFV